MSFDLEKLRNKLEQLKNPRKSRYQSDLWKPNQDGEPSTIRLIPYPFNKEDPFVELWFYYGIGQGGGILSPRMMYGKSDPVYDFAKSLRESGDATDMELAKNLSPKQRTYIPIIDRADPTATPKYWGFGKTVHQTLIEYLLNEDYANYMDVKSGLDLVVKYEKPEGKSYPTTTLQFKRKESPLADDDASIQKILNAIKPIDQVYQPLTKAQIQERLDEWASLGGEENAEAESKEVVKGGSPAASVVESMQSIDDAFEEALNS